MSGNDEVKYIWILGILMIGCSDTQNPQEQIIRTWYLEATH
ncbi:hypothetical protein [Helicobacter mastomyrinus]|uniref:Uncharacterized protein n=1 Tax=Helicobacter mastomyrinus TaxID=287948 RepID=A0ABZ3F4Z1_9HELI|nr:hypothetical protein [uncultured Helicobacter sp.]